MDAAGSPSPECQPMVKKHVLPKDPSFSSWCAVDGIEPTVSNASSVADSDDSDAPLVPGNEATDRTNSEKSPCFRQRSMHGDTGSPNGKRFHTFDIEAGAGGGLHTSESQLKLDLLEQAARKVLSPTAVIKTLLYILVWYTFSTCLTLYNKTLLGDKLGKFPAPLLMNTVHFALQAILSNIIVSFRSRGYVILTKMSWKDYFLRVVPTALGTALDINLSNASLVFITVTFATMCKSASPIFLLLFAFVFRLERPSARLLGIILIISIGVLLTVAKETEFELWGFVFVMLASVMSGFRWSMTQILLQKEAYGMKDPITLMSCVTPVMAISTMVLSLFMDPWHDFDNNIYFNNPWHIVRSCLLMLVGGALAFFMVLTEYILVSATSAVTVTIAGVVKEAVTIVVAVFYFHDQFTWLKGVGLLTIMIGVSLFNWYKYQKLREGQLTANEEEPGASNEASKYVIIDLDSLDGEET